MSKKVVSTKMNQCCEMTFCALSSWYRTEFEKLGWMILAHNKGMNEKVQCYQMSLKTLLESIELKIKDVKDSDKKHDLELMHHNLKILINHVQKDFKK